VTSDGSTVFPSNDIFSAPANSLNFFFYLKIRPNFSFVFGGCFPNRNFLRRRQRGTRYQAEP
jgi:hypothetical protein